MFDAQNSQSPFVPHPPGVHFILPSLVEYLLEQQPFLHSKFAPQKSQSFLTAVKMRQPSTGLHLNLPSLTEYLLVQQPLRHSVFDEQNSQIPFVPHPPGVH